MRQTEQSVSKVVPVNDKTRTS